VQGGLTVENVAMKKATFFCFLFIFVFCEDSYTQLFVSQTQSNDNFQFEKLHFRSFIPLSLSHSNTEIEIDSSGLVYCSQKIFRADSFNCFTGQLSTRQLSKLISLLKEIDIRMFHFNDFYGIDANSYEMIFYYNNKTKEATENLIPERYRALCDYLSEIYWKTLKKSKKRKS